MIGYRGVLFRPAPSYDAGDKTFSKDAAPWMPPMSPVRQILFGHRPMLSQTVGYSDLGFFVPKFSPNALQLSSSYWNPYEARDLWEPGSKYGQPAHIPDLCASIDEEFQGYTEKETLKASSPSPQPIVSVASCPAAAGSCHSFESIELGEAAHNVSRALSRASTPEEVSVADIIQHWAHEAFAQGCYMAHEAARRICEAYAEKTAILDLSRLGLYTMPPIGFLTHTRQIDLSQNRLTEAELPEELVQLRILDLRNNPIKTFRHKSRKDQHVAVLLDENVQQIKLAHRSTPFTRLWRPLNHLKHVCTDALVEMVSPSQGVP